MECVRLALVGNVQSISLVRIGVPSRKCNNIGQETRVGWSHINVD